ncbi:response regulator [Methanocalculus sp.]|uniref:response regulator n=1 Tax=Methanocalculus sp. TaxID=2004547 RepID=UPI002717921F|nr:response regulator [Methanocalculus sp.]MDO8840987.1 response regulator [Methanocalculus sp.]
MTTHAMPLRFFIVEDNAIIALDLTRRIEKRGHVVVGIADSADPAIQGVLETLPDCVLMDIRLRGEVDGIMVTEEINRISPRPVAYLTAYSDAGMVQRAALTNPVAFIIKPVRDADILRLIASIRSV